MGKAENEMQLKKRIRRLFRKQQAAEPSGRVQAKEGRKEGEPILPDVLEERGFLLCTEQVTGKGEDYGLLNRKEGRLLLGVFDGCGGSGARVYPEFAGHTGAYVASRAAAEAVSEWFCAGKEEKELKKDIDQRLAERRKQSGKAPVLLGSLNREFPSTLAVIVAEEKSREASFCWCGDSRGYVLDEEGLHQVTVDDATVSDPMKNLREDAPLTNVACASHPYELHRRRLRLMKPGVLLAATDGCFGYLQTPMEFEKMLLKTMGEAGSLKEWKALLGRSMGAVSGDDYTLCLWLWGFSDYGNMQKAFQSRLSYMEQTYPLKEERELFSQWENYRKWYECFQKQEKEK